MKYAFECSSQIEFLFFLGRFTVTHNILSIIIPICTLLCTFFGQLIRSFVAQNATMSWNIIPLYGQMSMLVHHLIEFTEFSRVLHIATVRQFPTVGFPFGHPKTGSIHNELRVRVDAEQIDAILMSQFDSFYCCINFGRVVCLPSDDWLCSVSENRRKTHEETEDSVNGDSMWWILTMDDPRQSRLRFRPMHYDDRSFCMHRRCKHARIGCCQRESHMSRLSM